MFITIEDAPKTIRCLDCNTEANEQCFKQHRLEGFTEPKTTPIHCLDCSAPALESCVRWHRVKGLRRASDEELSDKYSNAANYAHFHDDVVTLDGDFDSADLKAIAEDMEGVER